MTEERADVRRWMEAVLPDRGGIQFTPICFTVIGLLVGAASTAWSSPPTIELTIELTAAAFGQVEKPKADIAKPKAADKAKTEAADKAKEEAKEKAPAAQAADAEKKPDVQQVPMPLQRLLQGWFRPGPPPPGGVRPFNPGAAPNGARTGERDFIDSRAPHDAKVEQALRAAEAAIKRKDWKGAQEILQRLLDLPEDSLHRVADGRWQSVRRTANKLLGSAPAEMLDDYRTQYSGLAQQMLAAAKRSGRSADYVIVAARFFHTPAGYEAANHLGTLHFDRGEFGLAAAWFGDLADSPAAFATEGAWRLKAALAYRQAGNSQASLAMLTGPKDAATQSVELGSGRVDPTTWLNGLAAFLPTRVVSLADWTQLYGTVARMGKATGGEPLLSPVWSVPMTTSHTVRRRVSWIVQDLYDQDRAPILASMPLVVGGQALYRDLRGVRSVDLETGKTLWESIEGVSPERIVGGLPPQQVEPREAWRFRMNQFQNDQNEYQGQAVEYHPLANLLFRDGTFNLISSDGRQVFVIEDHGILSRNQPGQHFGGMGDGSGEVQDPYGVPWKTNRLVSYDLRTGRPVWSVGGVESREPFDLPLAGSYFYGVPAVDGDELLVVAGKGDDVRLWSLDRATGTPRWSQLIAYSDTKIEQDVGRRWFTAQVASDGGIIVCPTTVGWLVAVDRLRQSVLWAHRYLPPSAQQEREPGAHMVQQRDLSSQWAPSAPIISGSVVVYTPPEEPVVLALNALDGKRLWEKQKEQWLYLAGVFDDRVILVGRTEVGAFALATGKPIWTAALGDDARPSGRGLAVGDIFYLPLSTSELRTIDLKTGKTVSQTYAPPRHPSLGNLAMHRGKLVALGPHGLVGFGQREAVLAEIARRKALNPADAWAMLRESEIHLLNRAHAAALPLLRALAIDGLTDDEKTRHHAALVESLAAVIRLDPQSHADELTELGRVATAPDEKLLVQELTADKLIAEGRLAAAFDVFWTLADPTANKPADNADTAITRSDDRQVSTRRVPWISGRLSDVWSVATGDERKQIDTKIEAALQQTLKGLASRSPASSEKPDFSTDFSTVTLARLLAFHPMTVTLREAIVEDLVAAKDFGGAQLELLKLADDSDRVTAARAVERLARLMEQFKLPADAAHYYRRLAAEFADVTLSEGQTVAKLIEQRRDESKLDPAGRPRARPWDDRKLQLVQGTIQYSPPTQEVSRVSTLPYFDPLAVEVHPQEQRLAFESQADGSFVWLAPLRSSPRNQGDGYVAAEFLGHQAVVVNRDVLHLFSPVEKRLLWSKPMDGSGEGGPFWRHASRPQPQPMATAGRESGRQMSLLTSAQFTGRLAVVQPNYLCLYGRRSITVLDPRTGEELWRRDGLPQYSQVVGHRDAVFIVPQDNEKAQAYRALDGKPLKIDGLGALITGTLLTRGDSLLVLEQGPSIKFLGFGGAKTIMRLVNPLTKAERWKIELPPGSLVSALDEDELLAVSPQEGKAERIEIATGRRLPLDPLAAGALQARRGETFALADDDRIYLLVNTNDNSGMHHYGESLLSVRAHGTVYAWNRTDGKLAWKQDVKQQNLVVDRFRSMPVMLFVSRSWKQKGNQSYGTLSIMAIHKQSGTVLHDSTSPSMYSGFHSLQVNASEPSIELKSYNLRMRLVPTNDPVAEAKPMPMPAETNSSAPKGRD